MRQICPCSCPNCARSCRNCRHSANDRQSDRYRLFESVSAFLTAISRSSKSGLLLCLDDLQWADDSTLLLIEHVVRRVTETPFLIVATYRDTDLEAGRPFARTLEQLTRQGLSRRLDLKRLDAEDIGAMLAVLGRPEPPSALVEAIRHETEGNPFFVQEVFAYLRDEGRLFDAEGAWLRDVAIGDSDVPQSVRLVIGRRLERLSEECRRMLAPAAVLGRNFRYELLQAVSGLAEDDLLEAVEEAERAHLLTSEAGGLVSFAHELIRQTVLASLSALRRPRLHLSAALAIEELCASELERHATDLADHFMHAGTDAATLIKALKYAELAAEGAASIYAYKEAVRLFERAIEVQEVLDPSDKVKRCDLLLASAEALLPAGEPLRAIREVCETAYLLAEDLQDSKRLQRAIRLTSEVCRDTAVQA